MVRRIGVRSNAEARFTEHLQHARIAVNPSACHLGLVGSVQHTVGLPALSQNVAFSEPAWVFFHVSAYPPGQRGHPLLTRLPG